MGQALYRKYRSRSFDELVGQEHVTTTLKRAIEQGRVNHAYLFTGPRGVGKTSVARILAHAINQLTYSDRPHLDIIEIDAASNRRIEDVRDLREKVHIAPTSAPYKVYIIDEVHMLTSESFNALLKTLEEPPAHVVFILATTELHKLPATITSRTQRFAFRAPSPVQIQAHLRQLAKAEAIKLDDGALQLIAEHGDGSFRDSVSLLDQIRSLSDGDSVIDEAAVAELLGLPARSSLEQLADSALNADQATVLNLLRQLEANGVSAGSIAQQMIRLLMGRAEQPLARLIVDRLIGVGRSSHPAASLLLALLPPLTINPAVSPVSPVSPAQPAPARPAAPAKPRASSADRPVVKPAASPPVEEEELEVESPAGPSPSTTPFEITDLRNQWGNVLETVKTASPALHSILKTVAIGTTNGGLAITCRFAIHKKQLEQPRYKQALSEAIARTVGMDGFAIDVLVDASVTPSQPLTAALPTTPEAESILGVMGGGEMIQYSE